MAKIRKIKFEQLEGIVNTNVLFTVNWSAFLGKPFMDSQYLHRLQLYVDAIYGAEDFKDQIEPSLKSCVFAPFKITIAEDIKVVILGDVPSKDSNGILFGSDTSDNPAIERHTTLFGKNQHRFFDQSLTDWSEKGVLGLNFSPITVKTTAKSLMVHSKPFKKLYCYVLKRLFAYNPNLIVAITSKEMLDIVNIAGIPKSNIVVGLSYYTCNDTPAVNIYSKINEKLTELRQEPVEF